MPWLIDRYFTLDARSLALGRIGLALVLLLDLVQRVSGISTWYSDHGLLPAPVVRAHPVIEPVVSFFFLASQPYQAALGFLLCAVAYVALLVGYRTTLAHVASLVCVLSLHGRVLLLQAGGDVVLGELCLWTAFLPTGRRFSVDARRARQAGHDVAAPAAQPIVSVAAFALVFQLVVIYALNVLHKDGVTWREGSVVHYVIHQDRVVTTFGVWLRDYMTPSLSRMLSWAALATEAALPLLLLSPVAPRLSRRVAIVLLIGLHAGFALLLNLGLFSVTMIAFAPFLLGPADWAWIDRRAAGLAPRLAAWPAARLIARRLVAPPRAATSSAEPAAPASSPVRGALASGRDRARNVMVVVVLLLVCYQLLLENRAVPVLLKPPRDRMVSAAVTALQLFQGWSMFAPDAPRSDANVIVEAVTEEGRQVDPLNAEASRYPIPGAYIPARLGQNWLFCDYIARIAAHPEYHEALRQWILRYPERTGHAGDRITTFRVYLVEDDSPRPGASEPRNLRTRLLLAHP